MSAPEYAVLACKHCRSFFVARGHRHQDTVECRVCGHRHDASKPRVRFQHDDLAVVREIRSRMLAEKAGLRDEYDDLDDYGVMGDRVEERFAAQDDRFMDLVDDRPIYSDALGEATSDDIRDVLADEVEDYFDRSEQRLNAIVRAATGISTASPHGVDPGEPACNGSLSLESTETLPSGVDIRISDPSIARKDLWRSLCTDASGVLVDALGNAIETLPANHADAYDELVGAGVTAMEAEGLYAYANLVAIVAATRDDRRLWQLVELTRQLGAPTAYGNTSLEDVETGPVALLAHAGETPRVAVHITHEVLDPGTTSRTERQRLLRFLTGLARGFDVRLVCPSRLAARKLLRWHEADLPASVVNGAPQPYQGIPDTGEPTVRVAREAIKELGESNVHWDVLRVLRDASAERMPYKRLQRHTLFDVSESTVRKRVGRLVELGVVEQHQIDGRTHTVLLPAGAVLLDCLADAEASPESCGGSNSNTETPASESKPENADVNDPPNNSVRTVYPRSRSEGGTPRPSAEAAAASAPAAGAGSVSTDWMKLWEHHAAAAAVESLDFALSNDSPPDRDHAADSRVSFDKQRREIVVEFQWSPSTAYTGVRLCDSLLDDRVLSEILTPSVLDGEDGESLGALLEKAVSPVVLRDGRQLGYLPDAEANGRDYHDRLRRERNALTRRAGDVFDANGEFDGDVAQEVTKRAHGLAGTVTHLLDLLGWDVVRVVDFPEYARNYDSHRKTVIEWLATHTTICSRYGHYAGYRALYEPRSKKRKSSLGAPDVNLQDPSGDVLGSWVLRGPGIDRLASDLADLEEHLELQEDGENFAQFILGVEVGQATRLSSIRSVLKRLSEFKGMRPTRPTTSLFYAFTGSVHATAEAYYGLGREDDLERDLYVDEVRYALSTLRAHQILPGLEDGEGSRPARSRLVHALLSADEPLSTGDLADRADVSRQTIRNHREDLEAVGLLAVEEGGAGQATTYRLRLAFRSERGEEAPCPAFLAPEDGHARVSELPDAVHDLLWARGLAGEVRDDAEVWRALTAEFDPSPAVERWQWLRPWVDLLARLLGMDGGGRAPGEWSDGPYQIRTELGARPPQKQVGLGSFENGGETTTG